MRKNGSLSDNEHSIHGTNTRRRINRMLRVLRSCLSIKIFRGTVLLSSCLPRLSSQHRYEDSTPFVLLSYTFRRPASVAPRHHFDLPIETPRTSFPASSSPTVLPLPRRPRVLAGSGFFFVYIHPPRSFPLPLSRIHVLSLSPFSRLVILI